MKRWTGVGVLIGLLGWPGGGVAPTVSAQNGTVSLGVTVNDAAISPGETLVAGITVDNPAGGPLADVFFVILLPDGATVMSLTPGGPRPGTLANLRSLTPLVRGLSLAGAFTYRSDAFFSYTFSGVEPRGPYRLFFVAARAGGLDDGAIGAGDLLAVANRDVTFGASPVVVDSSRAVTTTVTPAGGVVRTTSADGMAFSLSLPRDAVSVATPITIAPLTSINGRAEPFVAGISAGPSGLTLSPPATLTITLPTGFPTAFFGLRGVVTDDNGGHEEVVPVSRVGDVVTVRVSHFSAVAIEVVVDLDYRACTLTQGSPNLSPQHRAACATIGPLADDEYDRLLQHGGPISATFKAAVAAALNTWLSTGLGARLIEAQVPTPGEPVAKALAVQDEWDAWTSIYQQLFGLGDRVNEGAGRPIGAAVDVAQEQLRLALLAGMNAVNIHCLGHKSDVARWIFTVDYLLLLWGDQFEGGTAPNPPFAAQYCVDLRLDAAPPPVVTVGQDVQFPIDVRLRFTDGVDLTGPATALVTVTASNGQVSPAGGEVSLPLSTNLTLTPTALSGTLTITAIALGSDYERLPSRSRTFPIGESDLPPIFGDEPELFGLIAANRVSSPVPEGFRASQSVRTLPGAAIDLAIPTIDVGSNPFASGRLTASRNIAGGAAGFTATLTGSVQLALNPPSGTTASYLVDARVSDAWRVTLSRTYTVRVVLAHGAAVSITGLPDVLRNGDIATVPPGERAVLYIDRVQRTMTSGVPGGETSATLGYTLTFTPVP